MITIPKIFHSAWIGPAPLSEEFRQYRETWRTLHPDWRMYGWGNPAPYGIRNYDYYLHAKTFAMKSNFLRFAFLEQFGGVYVDSDLEPRKNIEPLLEDVKAFAVSDGHGRVAMGIYGAPIHHPWLKDLVDSVPEEFGPPDRQNTQIAIEYFTKVTMRHPEVKILDSKLFYPYDWMDKHRSEEPFPDAYGVHRWAMSWNKELEAQRAQSK